MMISPNPLTRPEQGRLFAHQNRAKLLKNIALVHFSAIQRTSRLLQMKGHAALVLIHSDGLSPSPKPYVVVIDVSPLSLYSPNSKHALRPQRAAFLGRGERRATA